MIPLSEQYRINIKNAIELIDNTLKLVKDNKKKKISKTSGKSSGRER